MHVIDTISKVFDLLIDESAIEANVTDNENWAIMIYNAVPANKQLRNIEEFLPQYSFNVVCRGGEIYIEDIMLEDNFAIEIPNIDAYIKYHGMYYVSKSAKLFRKCYPNNAHAHFNSDNFIKQLKAALI